MIVVVVELWPEGDQDRAVPIASMGLANVTEGDALLDNYEFEMDEAPNPFLGIEGLKRKSVIVGYNRRQSVWKLVRRAIDTVFPPLIT